MIKGKRKFWCSLVIMVYVFFECASLLSFYILRKKRYISYSPVRTESISQQHVESLSKLLEGREEYLTYSSTLGWTIKPDQNKENYRSNSIGIRSNKEYTFVPQANSIRISTFGNSFTHGDDVQNHETWQEVLHQMHNDLEVLNFGVPGFGLDQAFLRFQHDGAVYQSHVIFIGFMSENIFRHVNIFRPFYHTKTGLPLSKPRFDIKNGQLILLENPIQPLSKYKELIESPKALLSKMGEHDYFFKVKYRKSIFDVIPSVRLSKSLYFQSLSLIDKSFVIRQGQYNPDSEAFKITVYLINL